MKKMFILMILLTLVLIGCTNTTEPQTELGGQVRPEFIDTRPQEVIDQFTLNASDYRGKPPWAGGGNNGGDDNNDDPTDPNPNPNNKYAVVIGISDYEGTQNDLNYCDDDADDWKNYLQGEGFTVRVLKDMSATSSAIESELNWLANTASEGDEIAFIYSGHGAKPDNSTGSSIISSDLYYLSHSFVMGYINGITTNKKMVAIDACEIGDFHDDCMDGTIMATASDKSYSYDGDDWMQNGAWTYYYIEALVTNGEIFNEDAIDYAETNYDDWGKTRHYRVTPKSTDMYTGKFDI